VKIYTCDCPQIINKKSVRAIQSTGTLSVTFNNLQNSYLYKFFLLNLMLNIIPAPVSKVPINAAVLIAPVAGNAVSPRAFSTPAAFSFG